MSVPTLLEWVKAGSTFVAAIGLILAYKQLKRNIQWNKLNASLTYLNSSSFTERERAVAQALRKHELNYHQEECSISDRIDQILSDPEVYAEIKFFLNFLELNAAAIRIGALSEEFAYHHRGDYYLRNYYLFKPLIERVRRQVSNPKYWSETQAVCEAWQKRKDREARPPLIKPQY